jgi:transposase-like protein
MGDMSRGALRLLRFMRTFDSGRTFMYQKTLAARLGCAPRTLREWLKELRDAGLIASQKRQHSSAEHVFTDAGAKAVEISSQTGGIRPSIRPSVRPSGAARVLGIVSSIEKAAPKKLPQVENLPEYARLFVRSLERCQITPDSPGYQPVVEAAAASGRAPGEAAWVFDRLIQEARFRGKSLQYLVSAFRGELVG